MKSTAFPMANVFKFTRSLFSWEKGKSGFTVPGSTIGSNPVKIVRTDSNWFVASPASGKPAIVLAYFNFNCELV